MLLLFEDISSETKRALKVINISRQERESCINNVKLNSRRNNRPVNNSTYTKRPREKLQRGSLENVSSNPWGEAHPDEQSSLRRTRSLAITREDVFTNLDIASNKPRRSQLIPRAKLIERSTTRDQRYALKGSNVENLQDRTLTKRDLSLSPPDYSPPLGHSIRNQKAASEAVYSSINNLAGPKFIIGTEQDSLDSNYHNKILTNTTYRVSYEDLPGLSLPNYYPDSKDDTDNTDVISLVDDLSTESCGDNNSKKYSSCDNISAGKWMINESESISYDDNIVLSTNRPLYDSIRENHYAKPRTIRGPTPYNSESQVYYREKKRSYSSDSSEEKQNKDNDKISLEYFETDSNLDEINLNNENITKIVETGKEKIESIETSNIEVVEESEKEEKKTEVEESIITNTEFETPLEEDEEYKTIVTVDPDLRESEEEENKHSHNYLREFLETQKGSKKPLQNFISKKFSNLSRKSSNLIDNRFYSLPDLAVSKNLRKCEKIDRKLRKCDKTTIKKNIESNESRFIVNIGKHFDITANANIPVDFELKIAKVPRKNKNKKNKNKPEEQFLEAVKSLKETLNTKLDENHNITKPEIVAVKAKQEMGDECTKEYQEKLGIMRNYWDKMINGMDKTDVNPPKCKIVDVQTKIEDVKKKFEPIEEKPPEKPSKVQMAKQLFEKKTTEKTEKISPFIKETCNYFENTKRENQFESLNPNIVEIIAKEETKEKSKHKPVSKSKSIAYPEFDHVRYRVVKSDLFQKKIFANCEKESQFDGLMQYLQDYSFQELLRDNNIVIIEPIRTKIPHEAANKNIKAAKNITPLFHKHNKTENNLNAGLKRHFFYHPIRVNKEVNDDELPNPDTVKQVRQFFEGGLKRSQSSQEFDGINLKCSTKTVDPDKDHCSATDSNSNPSNMSDFGSHENLYDSIMEHCCERQYVSEDILEKIRECGTTVTYYGGRVVKKQSGQPILTKAIMEEIKNNEKRSGECNCKQIEKDGSYQGVKFKLIKSNSCNSRLELVGTSDLKESKDKYLKNKQEQLNKVKEINELDKNTINENIKKNLEDTQPKIIGEERKMTQWVDMTKEKTYSGINFNNKSRSKITYDYHNYDHLKNKTKKIDDMEFEPYEVA
ncbi:hypothetical protein BDFB_004281 [Asbolus verrucosus]|uniref:Uncharacterized protein n=1 Tax=Asbolus verrucosus TaxID=1661398 RepID=A0A482VYG0_ASBVE|nr:hypothetical protein BDFB_004281 [Asbolus verrucosus]